jgi:hypothetical protein
MATGKEILAARSDRKVLLHDSRHIIVDSKRVLGERACAILAFLEQMDFSKGRRDRERVENIFDTYFNEENIPLRWMDENDEILRTQSSDYYVRLNDEQGRQQEIEMVKPTAAEDKIDRDTPTEERCWSYSYQGKQQAGWLLVTSLWHIARRVFSAGMIDSATLYPGEDLSDIYDDLGHQIRHYPKLKGWAEVDDVTTFIPHTVSDYASNFEYGRTNDTTERYLERSLKRVELFDAGLWLYWICPNEIVLVPRPALKTIPVETDADWQSRLALHSTDGPAVFFPNGKRAYFINSVEVSAELIETPAEKLDARLILTERNVNVRREIVRKIGIERICRDLNAICIDSEGDYELLLLDLLDGRRRPFLKMKNPSIGVYHIEGVAPHCQTVRQALAWRNQIDIPPGILT